jgi:hypothetical protein
VHAERLINPKGMSEDHRRDSQGTRSGMVFRQDILTENLTVGAGDDPGTVRDTACNG